MTSFTFRNTHSLDDAEREANTLIGILQLWGVGYLTSERVSLHAADRANNRPDAARLIQRLAECENSRVRDASISLFLLHPELADAVLNALQTSNTDVAEQISVFTLATLYLQRLWSIRLTMALGHPPSFPEEPFAFLWQTRHLPPPASHSGKWGLMALQELEQQRSGLPLTFIGDWQNQVDHLLLQEEAKHHPTSVVIELEQQEQEFDDMSMRPSVDKSTIEQFLRTFGQNYRKAGRLYLAGGAALVHAGIRSGVTLDIDVQVVSGDMLQVIDQMKQKLNINIKIASPKDFMPVPNQWEAMSQYVGRYGQTEVFYFDFYSIALSKIDRANTRDLQDVQLLVQRGIITLHELDIAFQDVLAQAQTSQGRARYPRFDPNVFAARYQAIRRQLQQP